MKIQKAEKMSHHLRREETIPGECYILVGGEEDENDIDLALEPDEDDTVRMVSLGDGHVWEPTESARFTPVKAKVVIE